MMFHALLHCMQYTVHGLNTAIQAHMTMMTTVLGMTGSDPGLDSMQMERIWNLKPDIQGGQSE
jgi:hypothetical protein